MQTCRLPGWALVTCLTLTVWLVRLWYSVASLYNDVVPSVLLSMPLMKLLYVLRPVNRLVISNVRLLMRSMLWIRPFLLLQLMQRRACLKMRVTV